MRRLLILALVLAACGRPAVTPAASAAASTAPAPSGTQFGVAGLIPRGFPNATAADQTDLYRSVAVTGGALGVYTNWTDGPAAEGKVPNAVASTFAAAAQHRFIPVVALGVARDAPGGVVSTVDWSSAQRDRLIQAATAVAREHKPAYLAIGVEANRLWMSDRAAFDGFVAGYAAAYDAVKATSPATRVFTVFQYELLRGSAYLMTGKAETPSQWELLARFQGKLDVLGLTTYPFLAFGSPAEIPDAYYREAADKAGVPLAFTEVGWPSGPIANAAQWGGTPDEQVAFVKRFDALVSPLRPALAMWSFPHDLGSAAPPTFASVALRANDGSAKPALAAWAELAARK